MSKSKYVQQQKKSIWSKVWYEVAYFFRSLFNNDFCIDARKKPWYAATIIGLVSVIVSVIPFMVAGFTAKGSDLLNSMSYGYEAGLSHFTYSLVENDVLLSIKDGKMIDENDSWVKAYQEEGQARAYYAYTITYTEGNRPTETDSSSSVTVGDPSLETKTKTLLAAYWHGGDSQTLEEYAKLILGSRDPDGNEKYSCNALFLGSDGVIVYVMPSGAESSKGARYYKWDSPAFQNKTLVEIVTTLNDGSALTGNPNDIAYQTAAFNSWQTLFDNAYESTKIIAAWSNIGVMMAVNVALTVLLGLIVFFMTRGKSNPFRIYTFWECQKIAYWASLTPAILAMALGFMSSMFAMMAYIFVFGMRIMWMSMRSLRPYQN